MFGCESYGELGMRQELLPAFSESIHQAKWNLLRSSESSKFVGLCLPHILLRQPYDFDERNKKFNFREDSGKTDLLWGNAAFAFAACVMRAFDERGWLGSISGAGSDGEARALPVYSYEDRNQCCTDAHISPKQELALTELGFLPLFENSLDKNPAFLNGYPLYEEKHCRPVRTLPYIFALSRIAHYLLAIARDRPEPFSDKEICEKELGTWLYNYTNTYDEEQNDDLRPLSRARIDVSKIHGRPGKLRAVIHLSFSSHLLEELPYGTRLVVDLP
jgi:type VI secretion system protein ImpC